MSSLKKAVIQKVFTQSDPYISRLEWLEIYKAIFSEKYEDWVKASKEICVWKARCCTLPAGIECTIPLLNAQLALADHSLDRSIKLSTLNMAILRFVSIVTKSYEQRYLMGKRMHNLAEKMNLPSYLVDMRNQIIHNDNKLGYTETHHIALSACLRWIQINYWKVEELKRRTKFQLPTKTLKVVKPFIKDKPDKASPSKLRLLIEKRVSHLTTECVKSKQNAKEKQLEKALNLEIISYSLNEPADTMNILVSDLFLSPKMIAWLNKGKYLGNDNGCKCKFHSIRKALHYLAPHILIILEIGGINLFIKSLIGDGTDFVLIRNSWLKVLVNMSVGRSRARNIFLEANEIHLWKYKRSFHWKEHLYTLYSFGENWTIALANYIHEKKLVKVNRSSMQLIKQLAQIYKDGVGKLKTPLKEESLTTAKVLDSCNTIYTLESVVNSCQRVSGSAFEYASELCCHLGYNSKAKMTGEEFHLGTLPDKVGQHLYKNFLLTDIKSNNQ